LITPSFERPFFGYFWLTIQNTTNRHVNKAFGLIAVFISFPLARAAAAVAAADFCCCCCWAPPPHPAPFILGEGSTKKIKSPSARKSGKSKKLPMLPASAGATAA
jgi:hypothetical protein